MEKISEKNIELNEGKLWHNNSKCKRCLKHISLGIIEYRESQCQDRMFKHLEINQDWNIIYIKWLKEKPQQQTGYYDKGPLENVIWSNI